MKKLVTRIIFLSAAFVMLVVTMHVVMVWRYQSRIDQAYDLPSDRRILFVGASQVACAIEQRPSFSNVVVGVSGTPCQLYLVHLKELEKRHRLENVKICAVPFNRYNMLEQMDDGLNSGWYTSLPITWRHWKDTPTGLVSFLGYVACSLKFPMKFSVASSPYPGRVKFTTRTEQNLKKCGFWSMVTNQAAKCEFKMGLREGWRNELVSTYMAMQELCRRHNIRFTVYSMPILKGFADLMPKSSIAEYESCRDAMKAVGIEYVEIGERPDDYFYDHIHLSEYGQHRFTDELFEIMASKAASECNNEL